MFINDTFSSGSPKGNKDLWKPTHIGNNVSMEVMQQLCQFRYVTML